LPANEPSPATSAQDVATIRQLAEIMSQHDLSEIHMAQGERRLLLRRGPRGVVAAAPIAPIPSASAPAVAQPAKADWAVPRKKLLEIKSEAIGIFYSRPKPEMDPFVKIGTRIAPDTPVGLIEAMKIFNEILAGCSGVIAEICVENQQPVEFGTVLFRVDPS
jgi:acetyl-CoA carboxylase biotin carboxyl carrier protein